MTTEEMRIECLRIAHSHGLSNEQVVERAKAFESFIKGDAKVSASAPATLSMPRKTDKYDHPKRTG